MPNYQTVQDSVEYRLGSYLEFHIKGFRAPLRLEKFSGGQSNPTYLLLANSGKYVLRRKPAGKLLASAHAVEREYKVIKALQNTEVPVPRVYHLCEDESIIGSAFYIMSFQEGRIFWDPAFPEIAKEQRQVLIEEQVKVLAAIHDVDVTTVGLSDFGKPGNYYQRQLDRWSKQYRSAQTERITAMDDLIQWLAANMPADTGDTTLIHGDYRLDNLIFQSERPLVGAVLDWELATLGHPLADLAYLCMCMRLPELGGVKGLAGKDRGVVGVPSEQAIIDLYSQLRGIDEIDNWAFYLAFSYFRIAAISQGVYARARNGNASNDQAVQRGNITAQLAGMATTLIEDETRR